MALERLIAHSVRANRPAQGVGVRLGAGRDPYKLSARAVSYNSLIDAALPTIIKPGTFAVSLANPLRRPAILAHHDTARVVGTLTAYREEAAGLRVGFELVRGVSDADDLARLVQAGALNSVSIGFDVLKAQEEMFEGQRVRAIHEGTLWEVSLVYLGADPLARIDQGAAVPPRVEAALQEVRRDEALREIAAAQAPPSERLDAALAEIRR